MVTLAFGIPETIGGTVMALLFAWWGANIAQSKGLSAGMGAVVGFLCNCVGILWLYLMVPREK